MDKLSIVKNLMQKFNTNFLTCDHNRNSNEVFIEFFKKDIFSFDFFDLYNVLFNGKKCCLIDYSEKKLKKDINEILCYFDLEYFVSQRHIFITKTNKYLEIYKFYNNKQNNEYLLKHLGRYYKEFLNGILFSYSKEEIEWFVLTLLLDKEVYYYYYDIYKCDDCFQLRDIICKNHKNDLHITEASKEFEIIYQKCLDFIDNFKII